jgi:hypothetical protein
MLAGVLGCINTVVVCAVTARSTKPHYKAHSGAALACMRRFVRLEVEESGRPQSVPDSWTTHSEELNLIAA